MRMGSNEAPPPKTYQHTRPVHCDIGALLSLVAATQSKALSNWLLNSERDCHPEGLYTEAPVSTLYSSSPCQISGKGGLFNSGYHLSSGPFLLRKYFKGSMSSPQTTLMISRVSGQSQSEVLHNAGHALPSFCFLLMGQVEIWRYHLQLHKIQTPSLKPSALCLISNSGNESY